MVRNRHSPRLRPCRQETTLNHSRLNEMWQIHNKTPMESSRNLAFRNNRLRTFSTSNIRTECNRPSPSSSSLCQAHRMVSSPSSKWHRLSRRMEYWVHLRATETTTSSGHLSLASSCKRRVQLCNFKRAVSLPRRYVPLKWANLVGL